MLPTVGRAGQERGRDRGGMAMRTRSGGPAGLRLLAGGLLAVVTMAFCAGQAWAALWPPGSAQQRAVVPDCPGCWVVEVRAEAAPGAGVAAPANPTCYGQPSLDFFRTALAIVAPRASPTRAGDLAAAIRALDRPMFEALREGSAADFRRLLRLPDGRVPFANCMPLAAMLPVGAEPAGVAVAVETGGTAHGCDAIGGACGSGGRFVQAPMAFAAGPRQAVGAVFMAEATGRAARLWVGFRMPAGWVPEQ